jgi:hypothetical protein
MHQREPDRARGTVCGPDRRRHRNKQMHMNGELPFLNILFRGGFFQLGTELVPHRRYHPVGKACITA